MSKEKKLNGIILVDKKKLGEILDEFKAGAKPKELREYDCNVCGDPFPEDELTIDPDIGCICEGCAAAKKELDDEQAEIETTMREEKKVKAGFYDKEGP